MSPGQLGAMEHEQPVRVGRRLAAIVAADVAGYSRLMGIDEVGTVRRFGRSVDINRNHPRMHFFLAAALAHLGRLDEARSSVQAGFALDPTFTLSRFRTNVLSDNPTYLAKRERLLEAMRLADVPEG